MSSFGFSLSLCADFSRRLKSAEIHSSGDDALFRDSEVVGISQIAFRSLDCLVFFNGELDTESGGIISFVEEIGFVSG